MLVNDNTNAFRSFEKVVNPTELLEIFDDPVILLDQQFFIKYINKACADSLEYSSSDLLGMPFFNLLQPSDIAEVSETLKTCVMSPNTKLSAEHAVIHKGRNVERYKTSAVSVRMSDEKLYIMLHMKNISEQYRIRELADTTAVLYEVIAEQASDSFLIHDYYGNLIQVNKKACDALGYTREELLKMTIMDIDPSFALQDAQLKWQDIEPGVHLTISAYHKRKDGTLFPVLVSVGCVSLKNEKYIIGFMHDMTDKKLAEEALKKSEQRYEALFKYSTTPALLTHLKERRIVEVNDAWLQLFEYEREEAVGKRDFELSELTDKPENKAKLSELEKNGIIKSVEMEMLTKSHKKLTVLFNASVIKYDDVDYALITYQDITERKRAEEKLYDISEKFKNVFDYSAIGMILSNSEGIFVDVNIRMCSMLGYDKEELEGKHFNDVTYSEDIAMSNNVVGKLLLDEVRFITFEKRYVRKNGEVFWAVVTTTLLRTSEGKPVYFISQIQDVTEYKKMEQELIAKERFSRTVMDNLPIGIAVNSVYPVVEFKYMNDKFPEFYRTTREQLASADSFWEAVYEDPEFREIIKNRVLSDVQSGDKNRMHWDNVPIMRKGKETSYVSAYNTEVMDEGYQISIVTDETERVRTLEALTRNTKRIKKLHEFDQEVIKGFSSYTNIGERVLTYIMELIEPDLASILICNNNQYILTYKDNRISSCEFNHYDVYLPEDEINNLINADRLEVYRLSELQDNLLKRLINNYTNSSSGLICPLYNNDKPAGLLYINRNDESFTVTDIEVLQEIGMQAALAIEQRRLQLQNEGYAQGLENMIKDRTAQLEAAVKELEAFTYSVSHDLRAPLRSISGFVRILLEDYGVKLDEEGKRICNIISGSAQQMGRLIDDLLSLSRVGRSSMTKMPVNMEAMVKEIFVDLSNERLRARIDFSVGSLPQADADPTLIRQVWTNLIDNAIKFSSKVPVARIYIDGLDLENEVLYSISDNGAGFNMKYQNKLFGIFQRLHSINEFEGTGVGLAIVQRIVARHGGKVWARAEENKGATFYFSLKKEI